MFADQLIKALASKNPPRDTPTPAPDGGYGDVSYLDILTKPVLALAAGYPKCQCQFFDFGTLDNNTLIAEAEVASTAFHEGFLDLPAPLSFFSCRTPAGYHKGLDLTDLPATDKYPRVEGFFEVGMLCFFHEEQVYMGPVYKQDTGSFGFTSAEYLNKGGSDPLDVLYKNLGPPVDLLVDRLGEENIPSYLESCRADGGEQYSSPEDFKISMMRTKLRFRAMLFTMLGRLNTDGVEKAVVLPPEKLNRQRRKRNQPELVVHTTVKISPYRAPLGHSGPREGDDFTPPRYHFRRGHVRRFQNGEKTWVRPCFVGDPENGCVQHDYVIA